MFTVSKKIKISLLFVALLLVMWKIASGIERARYAHTTEFAITKNLMTKTQESYEIFKYNLHNWKNHINCNIKTTNDRVGRSSYSALKRVNCVENGSVSSVVAIATALANVPRTATIRRMRSSIEIQLFTISPDGGGILEASPTSSDPSFMFQLPRSSFLSFKL